MPRSTRQRSAWRSINQRYSYLMEDVRRLASQVTELGQILEFLEQMNLAERSTVPPRVLQALADLGIVMGVEDPTPSALIPRVLSRQQIFRMRIASTQRSR